MVILKISQNSRENTCTRVSFLVKLHAETWNFIKKETLAQVFSCEFYEIFMNTFFTEHFLEIASVFHLLDLVVYQTPLTTHASFDYIVRITHFRASKIIF